MQQDKFPVARSVLTSVSLLPVAALKMVLVILGLILVPITPTHKGLYRLGPRRPNTYWERAIRNPVGGFDYLISHPTSFQTFGTDPIEPTKQTSRFAWRFRTSGALASWRMVWRYSKENYGELYVGWKLGSAPPRLDFALSLRPYASIHE